MQKQSKFVHSIKVVSILLGFMIIGFLFFNSNDIEDSVETKKIENKFLTLSETEKVLRIEKTGKYEYTLHTIDSLTGMNNLYSYNSLNHNFSLIIKIQ